MPTQEELLLNTNLACDELDILATHVANLAYEIGEAWIPDGVIYPARESVEEAKKFRSEFSRILSNVDEENNSNRTEIEGELYSILSKEYGPFRQFVKENPALMLNEGLKALSEKNEAIAELFQKYTANNISYYGVNLFLSLEFFYINEEIILIKDDLKPHFLFDWLLSQGIKVDFSDIKDFINEYIDEYLGNLIVIAEGLDRYLLEDDIDEEMQNVLQIYGLEENNFCSENISCSAYTAAAKIDHIRNIFSSLYKNFTENQKAIEKSEKTTPLFGNNLLPTDSALTFSSNSFFRERKVASYCAAPGTFLHGMMKSY